MHEKSLLKDLIGKIESIAGEHEVKRVVRVKVKLGALAHISAEHLRGHFEEAAKETIAQGAVLEIEQLTGRTDPRAQDIILDSIESAD